jgi:hypothetical protein
MKLEKQKNKMALLLNYGEVTTINTAITGQCNEKE